MHSNSISWIQWLNLKYTNYKDLDFKIIWFGSIQYAPEYQMGRLERLWDGSKYFLKVLTFKKRVVIPMPRHISRPKGTTNVLGSHLLIRNNNFQRIPHIHTKMTKKLPYSYHIPNQKSRSKSRRENHVQNKKNQLSFEFEEKNIRPIALLFYFIFLGTKDEG